MDHYRIYLLNAAGRIVSGNDALCANDEAARAAASELLEAGRDAEIWHGRRRVGRVAAHGGHGPAFSGIAAMVANDAGGGAVRTLTPAARPD